MLHNFLMRRRLRKAVRQSCVAFVRMQFVVCQKRPEDEVSDPWVLGYIYGASTATLDRLSVEASPAAYELLAEGYGAIFDDKDDGRKVLDTSLELRQTPVFSEAQAIGGAEISGLRLDAPSPFALGTYLSDNRTPEVRAKLRVHFSTTAPHQATRGDA